MDTRRSARNPWAIVLLILALSCAIAYGVAVLGNNLFNSDEFGHTRTVDIANLQELQATSDGFVCA